MDILNPADLRTLIAQQGKWAVSLYMPTHRVGREQQQDPIRLKNLLAEAETKLLANGLRRPEVEKLMRPAEELLWRDNFWRQQSDGLAIFITNDFSVIYRFPAEFEELLVIANSFHIKPLLSLLGRVGKFYILALSLNNVRLFQATPDAIGEIELNFPTSMDEALWMDEPEKFLNVRTGTHAGNGSQGGAGIFHGHDPADEQKTNILRFFRTINQGLSTLIEDKTVPMILAGVDYLLPIFREVNTYQNVLEDNMTGNPDRENPKELHEQAWKIVRPVFEESQKKALEKYEQLSGQQSAQATSDLNTAIKAARFGQVETLFVPLGTQIWGRYDETSNRVILDPGASPENEDLLDFAASETILNSGQVFAVPREQLPGGGDLAAILRYAVQPP
ncbi:MAG TPA: hypothetical protein VFQ13_19855 [Anaerolineales bacterium]|nr:hypothetical protein [Anaerolineales bacterium]